MTNILAKIENIAANIKYFILRILLFWLFSATGIKHRSFNNTQNRSNILTNHFDIDFQLKSGLLLETYHISILSMVIVQDSVKVQTQEL